MFVLRKIFGNGIENNYALGEHYQLILKETNSLEFDSLSKQVFDSQDDECYGFVVGEDIKNPISLWVSQKNYIMTDGGKTFDNLTYRG